MLYLVQHGEAVAKEQDPERPLSLQGEAEVTRMAAFLAHAGISVDRVFHSGKLRARQTADIFVNALGNNLAGSHSSDTLQGISPNDSVEQFLPQISDWDSSTMVVGHLPFLAKLISHLLIHRSEPLMVRYRPGSVVCLEKDDMQHWCMQWMVTPALLS